MPKFEPICEAKIDTLIVSIDQNKETVLSDTDMIGGEKAVLTLGTHPDMLLSLVLHLIHILEDHHQYDIASMMANAEADDAEIGSAAEHIKGGGHVH